MIVSSAFAIETPPELIAGLRMRDPAAFGQLYAQFERPIHTLAWRILADRDDARDVLQDTFMQVHARIEQFRGDAPFWSWLRRIAVNTALARLRAGHRDFEPLDEALPHASVAPHDSAHIDLERGLAMLPACTRSVLWLHLVEGYSHEEIAREFGRSLSFSKSQVQRGARRLRELLQSTEEAQRHAFA